MSNIEKYGYKNLFSVQIKMFVSVFVFSVCLFFFICEQTEVQK